ncbi:coiled-coil domain-containing protein 28A isoform X2 [Ischnura elegans]|uniref:coiled-coil domain-containing protein 28A isoform X2 n=1 Tax=Ischnura elegans TaxID=197161 RepID=UPI001ED88751|nr:coiled-coil domain-containing protein 28A isoform X2 [Ischnura elegans]
MGDVGGEECELQQLVPPDEVTPPVTPAITKVTNYSPANIDYAGDPAARRGTYSARVAGSTGASEKASRGASLQSDSSGGGGGRGLLAGCNVSSAITRERPSIQKMLEPKKGPTHHFLSTDHYMREDRKCYHHSFLSDVTDVRRMETALLHLLDDFHSGKLRAFGKDCSMEQMEAIREQQERLARLHFDLGAAQELFPPLSEEGLWSGRESMQRLIKSLEKLSVCIERLHISSASSNSTSIPPSNPGGIPDIKSGGTSLKDTS